MKTTEREPGPIQGFNPEPLPRHIAPHLLNQNGRPQGQLMPCEAMILGRALKLSSLSGKPTTASLLPN